MHKTPTPLTRLLIEKERLHLKCLQQEQKLNNDFAYIKANAGKLSVSALSHLFTTARASQASHASHTSSTSSTSHSPSKLLSYGLLVVPMLWELAQPMLISWGVNKAKQLIFGKRRTKKRRIDKV